MGELIELAEEVYYMPGQQIIDQGEFNPDDTALYLLTRGEAEVFRTINSDTDPDTTRVVKKIKEGEVFGHYAFFSENANEYSVRSTTYTTLYKITYEKFHECIFDNDKDY